MDMSRTEYTFYNDYLHPKPYFDICIKSKESTTFYYSQYLLIKNSEYFKTMLLGAFKETKSNEIVLEYSNEIIKIILYAMDRNFNIYSLTLNNIIEVIEVADALQIPSLVEHIICYVGNHVADLLPLYSIQILRFMGIYADNEFIKDKLQTYYQNDEQFNIVLNHQAFKTIPIRAFMYFAPKWPNMIIALKKYNENSDNVVLPILNYKNASIENLTEISQLVQNSKDIVFVKYFLNQLIEKMAPPASIVFPPPKSNIGIFNANKKTKKNVMQNSTAFDRFFNHGN